MATKTSNSSPRTVSSAKRASTPKSTPWGSIWQVPSKKTVTKAPAKVSTPVKAAVKAPVKAPVSRPVIPAGMPLPVAQAAAAATAKKGAQIKKAAAPIAPPVYAKTTPVVAKAPVYQKSLPVKPVYQKSLPTSPYQKSLPKSVTIPGSGGSVRPTSGGSGAGTPPVVATPVKPPVVTPPKPPVTTPPVTTPATGQGGTFNTLGGAGTRGYFDRKRQSRGPQTGLSVTPQMLMRLAGQRITNPR